MGKRKRADDGRPPPRRPNRTGVPLYIYVPRDIRAAIDALAGDNRRPVSTEVLIALESHLRAAGRMPPR